MSDPGPIPTLAELPREIATARLLLRPARSDDAESLFAHARDPEVARYVTWSAHQSIDETRGFIAWASAKSEQNIVWLLEHDGEPVGAIGLHDIRWGMRAIRLDRAELGYWIGRAHWGKGLMTEAAHAAVAWGFGTLGLHKINVMCLEQNAGSRRVIEKIGARFVGRAESDVWKDGAWHAHLKYELVSPA